MEKYYRVHADIDLDAIISNVKAIEKRTGMGKKTMAVVKADGYGHGDVAVAKAVYDLVSAYAVATLDEALNLRENGIDKTILILGYVDKSGYNELIKNDITIPVFDRETADDLNRAAEIAGKKALCHIKVDTGMRRIGLEPNQEGLEIAKYIASYENLNVNGIFTHFATADEKDKSAAYEQFRKFKGFVDDLKKDGIEFGCVHCANSAASMEMPETYMDMVRMGIAMYGMYPSEEVDKSVIDLKPAFQLKSHVTYVKTLEAGERIGYGGTFVTERKSRIATIPVGYGDGYPRALSSKGYVLINGKKAPITGRVCMDQLMADVTDIDEVSRDSVVTLIGNDGDEKITVEELAGLAGTFNYEFVCDFNKRIPRKYYINGKFIGSHDCFHEKWKLEI